MDTKLLSHISELKERQELKSKIPKNILKLDPFPKKFLTKRLNVL